jgi:hypothetical protein
MIVSRKARHKLLLLAVIFTLTALFSFVPTQPSYAADSGTISGTVTDMNSGKPLADITVELDQVVGSFYKTVKTDANGTYRFTGLADGEYYLEFEDEKAIYEFYTWDRPSLNITASAQSAVQNVQMGKAEHTVSGSINWVPEHLANSDVIFYANACRLNTAKNEYEYIGAFASIADFKQGKASKYELELPAGTYKIFFDYVDYDKEEEAVYQWYNKRKDIGSANVVTVDKDISGIDAVSPYQWQKQANGTWKYLAYDTALTGWNKVGGKWFLFTSAGIMQSGWKKVSDKWYYFGAANDGAMKTGWQNINGTWYHFGAAGDGVMKTGWQNINGKWYHFGAAGDGKMKTGWLKDKNKWYYFGSGGTMVTGTHKISGKKYVFNANGVWVK